MDRDFRQSNNLLKRSQIAILKDHFAWIEECNEFIEHVILKNIIISSIHEISPLDTDNLYQIYKYEIEIFL